MHHARRHRLQRPVDLLVDQLYVNGTIVTASITNEAVDDLGLKVGDKVHAVIKASDVMVAIP
jgi:molybdopterin-binding protein